MPYRPGTGRGDDLSEPVGHRHIGGVDAEVDPEIGARALVELDQAGRPAALLRRVAEPDLAHGALDHQPVDDVGHGRLGQ